MNKKKFLIGISALALIFASGLASCASVDQQTLKKAGVPDDQRAELYLIFYDHRLEKIDGVKQGDFVSLYGALGGWPGTFKDKNKAKGTVNRSAQVSAGEHTIIISNKALVGRKNYEGTFNFEAGKKYLVDLITPSLYENRKKHGLEGVLTDMGNSMKEELAGNLIIVIAESKKAKPTYPDDDLYRYWEKSIK